MQDSMVCNQWGNLRQTSRGAWRSLTPWKVHFSQSKIRWPSSARNVYNGMFLTGIFKGAEMHWSLMQPLPRLCGQRIVLGPTAIGQRCSTLSTRVPNIPWMQCFRMNICYIDLLWVYVLICLLQSINKMTHPDCIYVYIINKVYFWKDRFQAE